MNGKQLFKSDANRVLCGVCGGIGECLGIDPTIVRLVAVLLGLSGTGLLVYIIAAVIIPSRPAGL